MGEQNNTKPKTFVNILVEGGAGFQSQSPLSKEELLAILTESGNSRLGYAVIPTVPKNPAGSEAMYVWRQKIIGFVLVEVGEEGRIHLVTPEVPAAIVKDIMTGKK